MEPETLAIEMLWAYQFPAITRALGYYHAARWVYSIAFPLFT